MNEIPVLILTGRKVSCRYQERKRRNVKLHVHDSFWVWAVWITHLYEIRVPTPPTPEYGGDWITHVYDTHVCPHHQLPRMGGDWITHVYDTYVPTPSAPDVLGWLPALLGKRLRRITWTHRNELVCKLLRFSPNPGPWLFLQTSFWLLCCTGF